MPVLTADRLTKLYAGLPAVRDVSFSIEGGDILGYLGPNGSGKSTTVKMLTGLVSPTSGEVLFEGRAIHTNLAGYKRQLGYAPEEAQLYSFLTGWEYLELAGTLREMPPRPLKAKVDALLEGFGMYPHRHSPISSYSKGMRQRIMLIAALMHDPGVLILDEPFSGLDVTMAMVFRQVVIRLAQCGKAIFFCSPVLEVVDRICTHLVLLRKGAVVAYGAMEEIRAKGFAQELEGAFLRLTDPLDADTLAAQIVAAAREPCN